MANLENVDNTTEKTDGLVRKAWLLGLGVYVRGIEEIQSQFAKINDEKTRIFNALIAKGEEFTVDSTGSTSEEVREETAVDKRVAEVRKQLGLDASNTEKKLSELSQKVDELTAALDKLS
jgi:hypothetical protein